MRKFTSAVMGLAIATPLTLGGSHVAHAEFEGPTSYDVPMGLHIQAPPAFPQWAETYAARVPSNWGRVSSVLPKGLATGVGVNSANASGAAYCTPDVTEGGWTGPAADRQAFIDANCRVNHNTIMLNMATVAAPSDSGAWENRGESRTLRWRVSTTSQCLDGQLRATNVRYGIREYEFPRNKLGAQGSYICFAQSILVAADYYAGGTIKTDSYAYNVRGTWSVFKVVGLGDQMMPTGITATPRDRSVMVTWDYPNLQDPTGVLRDRIVRATTFTVTSTPDSRECTVRGRLRCVVTGLRNGVDYTFTVKATVNTQSITSAASGSVRPVASVPADPSTAPTANTPIVTSRNGGPLVAGTTVYARSTTNGNLRAGESVNPRRLVVCYVPSNGAACSGQPESYNLPRNLRLTDSQVRIPSTAAGSFMRISQYFTIAPQGWIQESPPAFYAISAPTATPSATPSATASASASASASAAASASASASATQTANVTPLTPRLATGSASRGGNSIDLWSMVTGSALPAGQSVGQRELRYCYARSNGGNCDGAAQAVQLPLNLLRATTTIAIPLSRAGQFIRAEQMIAISPGPGLIGAVRVSTVAYIPIGSAE